MHQPYFDQQPHQIRCEWGLAGIQHLAAGSDAIIIVDVFSFTTCVDLAVAQGARVYPFGWKDERADRFAASVGAVLAAGSRRDSEHFSLAPHSMLRLKPDTAIVLPSPNGAALSLATGNRPTFAGCLRNALATASATAALGPRITVIPAGERWPDSTLRPALEDLLGAGAILHALPGSRSPEAEAAVQVFLQFRDRLDAVLATCGSGKEAIDRGQPQDLELAADLNCSQLAPRLLAGAYRAGANQAE